MHTAAREMVYVAEQGLMADGKNTLDPTWQEMLNHATSKVIKKGGGIIQDWGPRYKSFYHYFPYS